MNRFIHHQTNFKINYNLSKYHFILLLTQGQFGNLIFFQLNFIFY